MIYHYLLLAKYAEIDYNMFTDVIQMYISVDIYILGTLLKIIYFQKIFSKTLLSSAFITPTDIVMIKTAIRLLITMANLIMYSTFRQMIFRQNFPKLIRQQSLYIPQSQRNYVLFANVNRDRIEVQAVLLRFWSISVNRAVPYSMTIDTTLMKWCIMLCWMHLHHIKRISEI